MAIIIDVPGIAAAGVDWPVLPSVSADMPLEGLISYLAVQGAQPDANGRISALAQWVGPDNLVASATASAPAIEDVGGIDWIRTTIARGDRLIAPPAPAGSPWSYAGSAGFSVAFPVEIMDLATNTQGLLTIGGFRLRYQINQFQAQKPYSGGTQTAFPAFDWNDPCVVGVTYDVDDKRLRIYRNGVLITETTSVNWGAIDTATLPVFGSTFNAGNPSAARFGDLVRYSREITASEMLAVSDFLSGRFGID
ncbi:hypothetical protein ACIGGE_12065 [Qipengyuania sp. NPDC077410]|uniref:hypothetical protein n=1 Tax=Qipengyuania sp. NPDC077410 TaxID=3364496 RepID=UPI0037C59B04